MSRSKLFLILFATLTLLGSTRADTIKTFVLDAHLVTDPGLNVSVLDGTITVDTDTGVVLTDNFDFIDNYGPHISYDPFAVESYGGVTEISNDYGGLNGEPFREINIVLPVANLIGYTGGQICSTTRPCLNTANSDFYGEEHDTPIIQGSLSLTPEPPSLVLLVTGLLSLIALPRFRSRFIS